MTTVPETKYAKTGDIHIAYQVVGRGPRDVVIVPGFMSFLLPIPLALFGPDVPLWMSAANIASGIVGLLVTVLLEIPRHNRLELARNEVTIAELIRYNWPRTASITVQAIVTAIMLLHRAV